MAILSQVKSKVWVKINCILTLLVTVLLIINYFHQDAKELRDIKRTKGFSPCCGYPCKNGGICFAEGKAYYCDCTNTGYQGKNCDSATILRRIKNILKLKGSLSATANAFPFIWKIINFSILTQDIFVKNVYATHSKWGDAHKQWATTMDYMNDDYYHNISFFPRSLPPVPKICPAALGVKGAQELPPLDTVFDKILKRKKFKPCPKRTNLLFATFVQHFQMQFGMQKAPFTKDYELGDLTIDMSQVYGKDEQMRNALRSFRKGRLKSRVYKGEEYPPFLKDCPEIEMIYPQTRPTTHMHDMMLEKDVRPTWAMGNPSLSMSPMLFALGTIWLREHNRVCEILAEEHRSWSDERLYQTAKTIITAEAVRISINEYVQHIMQYHFTDFHKPRFIPELDIQFTGRVPQEYPLLPHWQVLIPDELIIANTNYSLDQMLFTNNRIVFEHGLDQVINAMTLQPAGEMTHGNTGNFVKCCIQHAIEQNRNLRFQSYNNYRRIFGLQPMETFEELTGDLALANLLKEIYGDVEAVELFVGLLVEKKTVGIFPPTMATISGSWLLQGLLSHPINSPDWWKRETFSGKIGMNIVKLASLKKLICNNLRGNCKDIQVSFTVPLTEF